MNANDKMQKVLCKSKVQLVLIVILMALVSSCGWSQEQVEETKRRGDRIRKSLAEYRNETGAYPSTLTDLVPKYLPEIPQPVVGKKSWTYWIVKGGSFYRLGVTIRRQSEPDLQIDSTSESWMFDTK